MSSTMTTTAPATAAAAPAAPAEDVVRPFEARDAKIVKMLIGQGFMEGLAIANKRGESQYRGRRTKSRCCKDVVGELSPLAGAVAPCRDHQRRAPPPTVADHPVEPR